MPARRFDFLDFRRTTIGNEVALLNPDQDTGRRVAVLRPLDPTTYHQRIGIGTGAATTFTGTLKEGNLRPSSIAVQAASVQGVDNGSGVIADASSPSGISGTVAYDTGAVSVTFVTPPALDVDVLVSFRTYYPKATVDGGLYEKGDITFPNWSATAVTELFGFQTEEWHRYLELEVGKDYSGQILVIQDKDANGSVVQDTSIKYQISTDGGTVWKYWELNSPVGWTTGSSADDTFSTADVIAAHISTLTFTSSSNKKQLRVKARLFPSSDALVSPQLVAATVYHELSWNPEEDFKRSLKQWLEANLRAREVYVAKGLVSATTFSVDVSEGAESITYSNPVAYNLTTDPGRTTPLSVVISGAGAVTLAAAQTGDVEVSIDATVPAFIHAQGFTQLSTTRSVILDVSRNYTVAEFEGYPRLLPGSTGQNLLGNSKEPVGYPILLYRVRPPPNLLVFDIDILCQASREIQALAIQAAVRRLLDFQPTFESLASGEVYARVTGPYSGVGAGTQSLSGTEDDRITQGLALKRLGVSFSGWAHEGGYDTLEAVQKVVLTVGQAGGFGFDPMASRHTQGLTTEQ